MSEQRKKDNASSRMAKRMKKAVKRYFAGVVAGVVRCLASQRAWPRIAAFQVAVASEAESMQHPFAIGASHVVVSILTFAQQNQSAAFVKMLLY